jgi:transcriptional regulator with XRE-family HTH domain
MQHQMTHLSDLGTEVARLRKAKGWTQKELGAMAGMGQSTLARFETGQVAEFGSRKLLRLLELLGRRLVTVDASQPFTLDDALEQRRQDAGAEQGLGALNSRFPSTGRT